jgi:hypothetical protein
VFGWDGFVTAISETIGKDANKDFHEVVIRFTEANYFNS